MYNETVIKLANYIMKYPQLLMQRIVEDTHTEQYANIAFHLMVFLVIILMFFLLFIGTILVIKACWVLLQGICFWFFGRDTLKEFLIRQKEEDRLYIKELFKQFEDEVKKTIENHLNKSI